MFSSLSYSICACLISFSHVSYPNEKVFLYSYNLYTTKVCDSLSSVQLLRCSRGMVTQKGNFEQ